MDLTTEAIEADLQAAEMGGVPRGQIALVRAQIRATLAATQPPAAPRAAGTPDFLHLPTEGGSADIQIAEGPFGDSYSVPTTASFPDRIEAAARMLQVDQALLLMRLHDVDGTWEDRVESAADLLAVPPDVLRSLFARGGFDIPGGDPLAPTIEAPTDVEPPDDGIDEDFFAEARKSRGK